MFTRHPRPARSFCFSAAVEELFTPDCSAGACSGSWFRWTLTVSKAPSALALVSCEKSASRSTASPASGLPGQQRDLPCEEWVECTRAFDPVGLGALLFGWEACESRDCAPRGRGLSAANPAVFRSAGFQPAVGVRQRTLSAEALQQTPAVRKERAGSPRFASESLRSRGRFPCAGFRRGRVSRMRR